MVLAFGQTLRIKQKRAGGTVSFTIEDREKPKDPGNSNTTSFQLNIGEKIENAIPLSSGQFVLSTLNNIIIVNLDGSKAATFQHPEGHYHFKNVLAPLASGQFVLCIRGRLTVINPDGSQAATFKLDGKYLVKSVVPLASGQFVIMQNKCSNMRVQSIFTVINPDGSQAATFELTSKHLVKKVSPLSSGQFVVIQNKSLDLTRPQSRFTVINPDGSQAATFELNGREQYHLCDDPVKIENVINEVLVAEIRKNARLFYQGTAKAEERTQEINSAPSFFKWVVPSELKIKIAAMTDPYSSDNSEKIANQFFCRPPSNQ